MSFHTWTFALFFLIFYLVYLATKGTRFRIPWLVAASYVFYGCWSPRYLLLILYATAVDFLAVRGMARARWKKPWLLLSIASDLCLLGYFKYGAFIVETFAWCMERLGLSCPIPGSSLLPVGISFFIFRSLTYTIDCYRGKLEAEPSFLRYAAFVAFFPELLMGPVDRAAALLSQLRRTPDISGQDVADGLSLFAVGLFKKVAVADYLAMYVNKVYEAPGDFQSPALILATFVFAWQIYFDFSGYTDMARGIGRVLGFHLALNFNHPYLATGLGDFWRRWHISVSAWFKDYVYIPLGGNRRGELRTYVNMALTMVISGLWHGALWTFVIWGAVHAFGRVLTRALEATGFYRERVPALAKQFLTFTLVTFAWIFFRASSLGDAWRIVRGIFAFEYGDPLCPLPMLIFISCAWLYQFLHESRIRWVLEPAPVRIGIVVFMVIYVAFFAGSSSQGFIYEQF